jgi:rhodanese-like protein
MMKTYWRSVSLLTALLMIGTWAFASQVTSGSPASEGKQAAVSTVDRITTDELIAALASGAQPLIIDVRGKDYDTSDKRIKGAMRIVPAEFKAHVSELPRDREIVTYCACGDDGGADIDRERF